MGIERQRELRRRRTRRRKYKIYARKAANASPQEKAVLAEKIRKLSPGCEEVIRRLQLE
ncbi:MAG: hypothetical protein KatS3mg110_2629 [Pirellulaceae bacterium]|nr:MAG: hypothetical protein KatS3mg110_2629 [Pirellulaceae bacterium]